MIRVEGPGPDPVFYSRKNVISRLCVRELADIIEIMQYAAFRTTLHITSHANLSKVVAFLAV